MPSCVVLLTMCVIAAAAADLNATPRPSSLASRHPALWHSVPFVLPAYPPSSHTVLPAPRYRSASPPAAISHCRNHGPLVPSHLVRLRLTLRRQRSHIPPRPSARSTPRPDSPARESWPCCARAHRCTAIVSRARSAQARSLGSRKRAVRARRLRRRHDASARPGLGGRPAGRPRSRRPDRRTDRQTDRQTDSQTNVNGLNE